MGSVVGVIAEETPKFQAVRSLGKSIELRQYEPCVAAQVDYNSADGGSPFMILAGYIGVLGEPKNKGSTAVAMTAPVLSRKDVEGVVGPAPEVPVNVEGARPDKVAMTAPVVTAAGEASKTMQFILPSTYSPSTAPVPTDERVKIVAVPGRLTAVATFSGKVGRDPMADANVTRVGERLMAAIKEDGGLTPLSTSSERPWYVGQFNPPWTPVRAPRSPASSQLGKD